jgi:hypothetical protein
VKAHDIGVIESAQTAGYVDPAWLPMDLLHLLFGVALAWAQTPHPDAVTADPAVIAARRGAAMEAARQSRLPQPEVLVVLLPAGRLSLTVSG